MLFFCLLSQLTFKQNATFGITSYNWSLPVLDLLKHYNLVFKRLLEDQWSDTGVDILPCNSLKIVDAVIVLPFLNNMRIISI